VHDTLRSMPALLVMTEWWWPALTSVARLSYVSSRMQAGAPRCSSLSHSFTPRSKLAYSPEVLSPQTLRLPRGPPSSRTARVVSGLLSRSGRIFCTNRFLFWFFLWPPYVIGQAIYIFILSYVLLSFCFFLLSSPNLIRRRLDVYHTCTHGVALVRI